MTNKTTEALKLAEEALENYGIEGTKSVAGIKCTEALAAIREALAEPTVNESFTVDDHITEADKMVVEPEPLTMRLDIEVSKVKTMTLEEYKEFMQPVKQEPVAVISESAIGLVKLHSNGACLPFGTPLYAAPVQPVKQEPEYWEVRNGVCKHGVYRTKEQAEEVRFDMQKSHDLSGSLASFNVRPLYAAPVSVEAIRAEAYQQGRDDMKEEAAKWFEESKFYKGKKDLDDISEATAAAIRGLK